MISPILSLSMVPLKYPEHVCASYSSLSALGPASPTPQFLQGSEM